MCRMPASDVRSSTGYEPLVALVDALEAALQLRQCRPLMKRKPGKTFRGLNPTAPDVRRAPRMLVAERCSPASAMTLAEL